MGEFVRALLERHVEVRESGPGTATDEMAARVRELSLADGAFRYHVADRSGRPPQVAVIGPTQSGKSTIVNLILGATVATPSPLAGFTAHAEGFEVGAPNDTASLADRSQAGADWARQIGPGLDRREREQLRRDAPHAFSLEAVGHVAGLPACVVWDTPDFDSVRAGEYQAGLIEIVALADVVVLTLSKEKYADLTVWRTLRLLAPLGQPLIVCLNKLTSAARGAVSASLRERLEELGGAGAGAPLTRIEYCPDALESSESGRAAAAELRAEIARAIARRRDTAAGVRALVRERWADWLAPIHAEHAALHAWERQIETSLAHALEAYRRDFLDHPQRYDTFRRATLELLQLLEIPRVGSVLSQVRQGVTYPARWLLNQGRSLVRGYKGPSTASEELVLIDAVERVLRDLERAAARNREQGAAPAVWSALWRRLDAQERALRERLALEVRAHRARFEPEIQAAANRLYEQLQQRPALLNTLRAARATTDAVSILIGIKSGGMSVNDLLFAPAMFGLTSLLTEGALGAYMRRVADELKQRQLDAVRDELLGGGVARELRNVAQELEGPGLFGVSREDARRAEAALEAWEGEGDG